MGLYKIKTEGGGVSATAFLQAAYSIVITMLLLAVSRDDGEPSAVPTSVYLNYLTDCTVSEVSN